MIISKFKDYKDGWFIGNFEPSAYKTEAFEVCYKIHKKGERWATHYHKIGTEINYLIEGKMQIQGKTLESGDVFIIPPYEIADPIFVEDCKIIIVKTPSSIGDKYTLK
jgi:quercetin dioxygenase-like cupin family protein